MDDHGPASGRAPRPADPGGLGSEEPALLVRGVSKAFLSGRLRRQALRGVGAEAPAGSVVAVVGPNGSGKSTLLRVLAGTVLPDSGEARLFGQDPASAPAGLVGFAPGDDRSFYGRLTGIENLRFFGALQGLPWPAVRARVERLGPALGLWDFLGISFQAMSAGMKQRLALARAFLHEPRVLLLDEPCRSLDEPSSEGLRALLAAEYAGRAGRLAVWAAQKAGGAGRETGLPADIVIALDGRSGGPPAGGAA